MFYLLFVCLKQESCNDLLAVDKLEKEAELRELKASETDKELESAKAEKADNGSLEESLEKYNSLSADSESKRAVLRQSQNELESARHPQIAAPLVIGSGLNENVISGDLKISKLHSTQSISGPKIACIEFLSK